MARRNLLAECGGARSGTNAATDQRDAVASRRGDRYVWAKVRHLLNGDVIEVTMWSDGRYEVIAQSPRHGETRRHSGKFGDSLERTMNGNDERDYLEELANEADRAREEREELEHEERTDT